MNTKEPPPLDPDDIELQTDARDRFVDAVKRVARRPPAPKPKPPKRRSVSDKRER